MIHRLIVRVAEWRVRRRYHREMWGWPEQLAAINAARRAELAAKDRIAGDIAEVREECI